MITSTPINIKDHSDIRWIKESKTPPVASLHLQRIRQRTQDIELINEVSKAHGYTECPNAANFAIVESTPRGKEVILLRSLADGAIGKVVYVLQNGRVTRSMIYKG